MLSLFIMYSADRRKVLDYTISCLRDMPEYPDIQKTLIVDDYMNECVEGFKIIEVPRCEGRFSWANMWDAGVVSARHEIVVYLDSDRLLPKNFLTLVKAYAQENVFLSTSRHFIVLEDLDINLCKKLLANPNLFLQPEFIGKLRFEARSQNPLYGPGKNVMSGSVAFTRATYRRLGGVDPWYCGHGAYADTDFHLHAALKQCQFVDLKIPELHYHHQKLDNQGDPTNDASLRRAALDNFIYFCRKWKLPAIYAEQLAAESLVASPEKYVKEKWEQYDLLLQ